MTRDGHHHAGTRPPPGARFVTGGSLFEEWATNVRIGTGPILYQHAFPFPEIGPGLVTLIGGPPGSGKTTICNQIGVEMLRFNPDLRILFCNCEMSPAALMDKTLARISGVDAEDVRHRRLGPEHDERIAAAMATIGQFVDRMGFLSAPFDIRNVAASADAMGADAIVLDYVQRFTIPADDSEARHRLNRVMDYLRQVASAGVAVLVISAVGRSRDRAGRSSYASEGLSLASFRDSSELEFGADDALILAPIDADDPETMRLSHFKARHGMQVTQDFVFDRRVQSFSLVTPVESAPHPSAAPPHRRSSLQSEIRLLWESSSAASDVPMDETNEQNSPPDPGPEPDAGFDV